MTDTANLGLPVLAAAQAQKHVTHNEALRILDTLVQLAVLDRDLAAPPASPTDGQRWIVAAGATGAWAGHVNQVAAWQDGAWQFSTPRIGWVAFVVDEGTLLTWNGSAWGDFFSTVTAIQNLSMLGIGTTADATNVLSAKLNNALWTAKTVADGGSGDLRYKLNKESAGKTLSLLFQDAYSGRAEIGLTGDDDFHFKVSADGASWFEGLAIDRASGGVRFLANETNVASASACNLGAAASLKVNITGATTITSFGSVANAIRFVRFAGALTLTHNATSLVLPGGANIITAAGDMCIALSDNSGNWRVCGYQKASGKSVVGPASTDITDATATGRAALTAANAAALATAAGFGAGNSPAVSGLAISGTNLFPFSITTNDSGSTNGPLIVLERVSASPATGDSLGGVQFNGRDSGGNVTNYGGIVASLADPTDGSEDSQFTFVATTAGALANEMKVGGGLTVGSPTGGNKGIGTINATAVYDDNVLLTCGPIDFAKTGKLDLAKWDALVPDRVHPELKQDTVRIRKQGDKEERVVVGQKVQPARTEVRQHHVMRQFKAMLDEGFDPRDPQNFVDRMLADGAVPGLMTEPEWRAMIAAGDKPDSGTIISRTHLALDNLAVAFAGAMRRIAALEASLAAIAKR
jgi:hypothetical protein